MDVTAATGRLQGKQVLVTGGTTGLGFAIAERFLCEGARVVVTGRDEELGSHKQSSVTPARSGSSPLTLAIRPSWRARWTWPSGTSGPSTYWSTTPGSGLWRACCGRLWRTTTG